MQSLSLQPQQYSLHPNHTSLIIGWVFRSRQKYLWCLYILEVLDNFCSHLCNHISHTTNDIMFFCSYYTTCFCKLFIIAASSNGLIVCKLMTSTLMPSASNCFAASIAFHTKVSACNDTYIFTFC